MDLLRWLALATALVQVGIPTAPRNFRIVDGPFGCPSGQVGTFPNCFPAPPAPVASGKQWRIAYSEEFNGTALDPAKLTPCFDWNFGACTASFNTGKERYLPSQVQISNGTAKLVAEPLVPPYASSACYQGQCTYKAGLVSTARARADNGSAYLFPFTYGYIESRMKFPGTPGFFTAFWMLPTNPSFSYNTEMDIVEILGGFPDTVFMTYHYNGRSQSFTPNNGLHNNGACQVRDYSTDFVRFGLDWQPTHIAWYIDGVKCGQFNGNASHRERPDAADSAHDDRQPVGTRLGFGPVEPDPRAPARSGLHPHLSAAVVNARVTVPIYIFQRTHGGSSAAPAWPRSI